MFRSRRSMSRAAKRVLVRHIAAGKRYPIISLLDIASGSVSTFTLAVADANNNNPTDLSVVDIPPHSIIRAIHLDLTITQGAASGAEGFIYWTILKNPGNAFSGADLDPQTISVRAGPYVVARGGVGFNSNFSGGGEPYRISGWFKLHRHSKFMSNDKLLFCIRPTVVTGSVQGAAAFKYRV